MSLAQKRAELDAKRKALKSVFDEAGVDLDMALVKSLTGDNAAKAAEIKRLNTELSAIGVEVETLVDLEKAARGIREADEKANMPVGQMQHPAGPQPKPEQKSIGQLFIESDTYTKRSGSRGPQIEIPGVDIKTLMTTSAGWAPQSIRAPGYVESVQVRPNVVDIIPFTSTDQPAYIFMVESTFTNNAAGRAEGANNAGEAALALTATTFNIGEIAVWIPVTREQMDDVQGLQGYINNRLTLMIRQKLDAALLTGVGAPSVTGILATAGIQTQAKGADPVFDALHKAMTLVEVTGMALPNAIVMHPNDYEAMRLTRTADGIYILGSPMDPGPIRIWGLPIIRTMSETENTALVGDFANYCLLLQKQGLTFEFSDSHASLFIQRTLAILASIRIIFPVTRPLAYATVTGI